MSACTTVAQQGHSLHPGLLAHIVRGETVDPSHKPRGKKKTAVQPKPAEPTRPEGVPAGAQREERDGDHSGEDR